MMKKLLSIAICAIVLFSGKFANAQTKDNNTFAGTIKFAISYPGAAEDPIKQGAPADGEIKISGTKIKSVAKPNPQVTSTEIDDFAANTKLQLIDIAGLYKFASPLSSKQVDSVKKVGDAMKITETKETKVIAGYTCTKYTTEDEEGNVFSGYFTKEIAGGFDNWDNPYFRGVKGTALEFEIPSKEFTIKFTTTEVKKEAIAESEFTVPAGFKVVTEAEFMAEMAKLQGGGK